MEEKVENWSLNENGLTVSEIWQCGYRFQSNDADDFMIMEFRDKEKENSKYELYMFSTPSARLSLPYSEVVKQIEIAVSGEGKRAPGYGLILKTNDLWELFEWVEKMKVALSSLHEAYGVEKKS